MSLGNSEYDQILASAQAERNARAETKVNAKQAAEAGLRTSRERAANLIVTARRVAELALKQGVLPRSPIYKEVTVRGIKAWFIGDSKLDVKHPIPAWELAAATPYRSSSRIGADMPGSAGYSLTTDGTLWVSGWAGSHVKFHAIRSPDDLLPGPSIRHLYDLQQALDSNYRAIDSSLKAFVRENLTPER